MTFVSFLSLFLELHVVLAVAFAGLLGIKWITRRGFSCTHANQSSALFQRDLLKLHYVALAVFVLTPLISVIAPRQEMFDSPAKIWAASSMRKFREQPGSSQIHFMIRSDSANSDPLLSISSSRMMEVTCSILLLASLTGFALLARELRQIHRVRNSGYLLKRIGKTSIYIHPTLAMPFSFRSIGEAMVLLPMNLVSEPAKFRMALKHELQHHRQGDTLAVYAVWLLRTVFFANPFVHLWAREISEIQEYACDETLVDLKKVDSHAYASLLVEVAETANRLNAKLACATGFAFMSRGTRLKRRIESMLMQQASHTRSKVDRLTRSTIQGAGVLAVSFAIIGTALASRGIVQDRRITMPQAERMAKIAEKAMSTNGETLPVVMNARILRQLNRYLGTPEGREYMRNALSRMENERADIERALDKYGMPREFLAIPIIESGYRNLTQGESSPAVKAAGLWQFIPSTARNYGLEVSDSKDERLNIALETDAAMRLLMANKLRFGDWWLSLSAYNAGEGRVQEGIDATGSRDAWTLVGKGFEGDTDYLAKVAAAIIIMKNPDSVQ